MNFGVEVSKDEASDILEAQAHIWKYIFNFINSMSLKCAVELGIPDTIHEYGKPMSISTLATTLSINPVKVQPLNRLMRILTRSGFFSEKKLVAEDDNKEEGYVLTKVGQLILRKNPLAVTPFLLTMLNQDSNKSWNYLGSWFHNADKTAFQTAHGKTMWEFADHMPEFNECFNEAMASDSKLVASCLLNNSNRRDLGKGLFEGLNSLVDVGGGTGTMTKAIANAYPQLNCICFDLPHVIAGLQGTTNMTFVGGDMFKAIPQADAILLKWLLHTLNDEDCVKIMKQCKQAIMKSGKRGKVIIIDIVMGYQIEDHESLEIQLLFDLQVMVWVGGKQRTEREWHKLFLHAGFSQYKITSKLGVRSIIQVYP